MENIVDRTQQARLARAVETDHKVHRSPAIFDVLILTENHRHVL